MSDSTKRTVLSSVRFEFDGEDRRRAEAVVFAGVRVARVRVEATKLTRSTSGWLRQYSASLRATPPDASRAARGFQPEVIR